MEKKPLYQKFLTPELYNSLKNLTTQHQVTLDDVIESGIANPDSSIGAYAGDAECYQLFGELFNGIIQDYHSLSATSHHKSNFHSDITTHPAIENETIKSTRIRVARNLNGYAFPAAISKDDRLRVEEKIVGVLLKLTGDFKGEYFPLEGMHETIRQKLVEDHILFKQGDRFLEASGSNRDWPSGRGIFCSDDKEFIVWINEEDHLRIISMEKGADIIGVFERLKYGLNSFADKVPFAFDQRLGFLSSCPTNLGTAMRASVHIKLAQFAEDSTELEEICQSLGLSVRGTHGEHSENEGAVFDISNKHRLGITESEIVKNLYSGVQKLISL